MPHPPRPVVLCILDGWGYRAAREHNAIALANAPTWNKLWESCPHALLHTDGLTVGLPEGQMGNSEVGHMTVGAGRVIMQDLPKIDLAVKDGTLGQQPYLTDLIAKLKERGGTCHLMGLCSPGGVHAHESHILALAKVLSDAGVPIALHAFTDGRDVAPQSAAEQIGRLHKALPKLAYIATISGRYYAMDRDKRWERTELAYRAMVEAKGPRFEDPVAAIKNSYASGVNDEFIIPTVERGYRGMEKDDAILFANFRADRARQMLTALLDTKFLEFDRPVIRYCGALGMVEYSAALNPFIKAMFPPKELKEVLGELVSKAGKKQLRIAETEKYAHVTFFLNGGEERVYEGEDRILVPSPKVATYDLQPEMSAPEVTAKCVDAINSGTYDLIVLNFANADMVGHTGILPAAIKAVEAVDAGLTAITAALAACGGALLITADHGNCEELWDESTKGPHTAHSMNPVPVLLFGGPAGKKLIDGTLADIAPTVLELMQLAQPESMTGKSLLA
jgi:2,3-bisphosphoglycerate-independent phosphoglycerate mutase